MEFDREVVREEEIAAREAAKKKRFTLFKSKSKADSQVTSAASSTAGSVVSPRKLAVPTAQTGAEEDDDLPERVERPTATTTTPSPPQLPTPSSEDPPSNIPTKAGFDFKAIAKVIGKDDLNPSAMPMVPAENRPSHAPKGAHVAPVRTGSAPPPLPKTAPPTPTPESDLPTPTPKPLALPEDASPLRDTVPLPVAFHRSVSLDGSSSAAFDEEDTPTTESYNPFAGPSKQAPSWPPRSSLLSFASSEGSVWNSSAANEYSSSSSSSVANPGPLRRQAPPAISFGALNGTIPTSSTSPAASVPQLSFGSADGDVAPLDPRDPALRDPWAPKPIGLDAAIARKTNYALNPWET